MKHIILIILIICIGISKSESQEKMTDANNNAIMIQLKNAYQKQDYNTFWNIFPNNFQQFIYYYGFENYEKGNLSLYEESYKHIMYLFSDNLIKDKEHIEKLVSIAIDGYWDADASNHYQDGIQDLIIEMPDMFIDILLQYSDAELEKFWSYILDAPFPFAKGFEVDTGYKKFFQEISEKICNKSDRMNGIVKKAYKKILDSAE